MLANATLQQKFLDDFGALGNDELLAMMELMAKNNGAAADNWILMLQNTIEEERKLLAYLESSTLSTALIRYYDESSLKNILEKLDEKVKQKFLKDYGNLDNSSFQLLTSHPIRLELILDFQNIHRSAKNAYNELDIIRIIRSNLTDNHIGTLKIRNKIEWVDVLNKYPFNINFTPINKSYLDSISNRIMNSLSLTKQKLLKGRNRLFIKTQVFDDNSLVNEYHEIFISGNKQGIENIFKVNNQVVYPSVNVNGQNFTIINQNFNFDDFDDFAVKAIDDENISRFNDTELKYVFHFLENRWNSGNRFVIEMESVLYNCTSCQLYLQALKEYGKTKGKDINIIFKAHPNAVSIEETKTIQN
ncbi:hypothetical protein P0M11_11200 [Kaistella sp. PBT33-4]|uniref:hypothetical protein n=1 Tax=Kaistella sp. PBT33-4 TaxID=3032000 RepID=UPI0023D8B251|nr:hypothetical protein [Kaistella sp. PBT33-4]MDF0720564.1 hypothetical protein [Kaistella sp. PBT33-4]